MLSDDTLDKLVDIIANRQNDIANEVIEHIAERIKEIGMLKVSDAYKLEMLLKTGSDINKINKALAKLTNKQVKDIKKLLEKVAQEAYVDTKPFYEYKGMSFIPYDENIQLKKVVNSIAKQTANTYINLSKSQAFMLRDSNGKLRPTKLSATYQKVVDKAVQAVQIGVKDYNGAMRNTMKELIDSGIRSVEYTSISGRRYTQRLDTAVRRNLMDGIRAINQGVQDETGKQFGADGKEITVHMNPAPDHQYVQGHQLTNEEYDKMQQGLDFKDVNGKKFDGFDRAIGTLNCRHFAFSILIGAFKPNYTKEQLDDILKKNQEGYTLPNGRHLTMYECTQLQRNYELNIRKAKDGQILSNKAGMDELTEYYQRKVDKLTKEYKWFSKECGLTVKREKMFVEGYKKVQFNND